MKSNHWPIYKHNTQHFLILQVKCVYSRCAKMNVQNHLWFCHLFNWHIFVIPHKKWTKGQRKFLIFYKINECINYRTVWFSKDCKCFSILFYKVLKCDNSWIYLPLSIFSLLIISQTKHAKIINTNISLWWQGETRSSQCSFQGTVKPKNALQIRRK